MAGLGRALAAQIVGANPSRGGDAAGPAGVSPAPSPVEPPAPRPGFVPDPPRPPALTLDHFREPAKPVLPTWPCASKGHVFGPDGVCDYCPGVAG